MNETVTRLLTAAVLAPLSVWLLVLGGWSWTGYATVVALICQYEFFGIMEARGYRPHRQSVYGITIALFAVAHLFGMELAAGMLTAGILALLVVQLTSPPSGSILTNTAVSMTAVLYVAWLLTHGIYLRTLASPDGSLKIGVFAVIFTMLTTFVADTGAYFAGRSFGKNPIAPRVSPKKTWEGLAGGVVAAGLGAWLIKLATETWFHPVPYSDVALVVFGIALALVGFVGDLVESLIKRDADVKDSGSILPGHGGFLDRIDAILFTLPFAYYVFITLNLFLSGE